jgi:aspartate-semialdehyde dehydrogenase
MEFWLPRGLSRFHFTGGARYVHGGATLQEVVVPVVLVKHRKDKGARDETKITTVTVHVLGSKHKITASRHRFELIQMEPVSERVKALTLRVAVYEGAESVTNVETITFDSASGNMDERKKWVQLVLKDRQYDKKTLYRLVLRDAATDVEHQSAEVTIDRAYGDDF